VSYTCPKTKRECRKVQALNKKIKQLEARFKHEHIFKHIYQGTFIPPELVISVVLDYYGKEFKDILKNYELKQALIWLLLRHCFKNSFTKERHLGIILGISRAGVLFHLRRVQERMNVIENRIYTDKEFHNKILCMDSVIESENLKRLTKK